jgi:AraC family transcriptional regulator of adaptative response / DNA-3-methyladenine glycosylase II
MQDVFRSSPRALRERRRRHDRLVADGGLNLRLPFNPPFDWDATLRFLAQRAIPGVESVDADGYYRTIVLDGYPGVLELKRGGLDHLHLRVHLPFWEGLIHVVERAGRMMGIDTDVAAGEAALGRDPLLGSIVRQQPGLRIPGAWGPFEVGVHAIISQTLDLASTRDALATIVRAHGTHVAGLAHGLTHAFPSADTLADANLAASRLPRLADTAVTEFASAVAAERITLDGAATLDELISSLIAIPGVGTSTAQQIALRLGYHDAFPHADPLVQLALEQTDSSIRSADEIAEPWRPWRALAATHLVARAEALPRSP